MPIDIDAAAEAAFTRLSAPEAQPAEDTVDDMGTDASDGSNTDDGGTVDDAGQPEATADISEPTSDEPADELDESVEEAGDPQTEPSVIPEDAVELEAEATFVVEVDGTPVALTGEELRNGYLRHDDYTRKRQADAAARREAEDRATELEAKAAAAQELEEQVQQVNQWYEERASAPPQWMAEIAGQASQGDPRIASALLAQSIMLLNDSNLLTDDLREALQLDKPSSAATEAAREGELETRLRTLEEEKAAKAEEEQRQAEYQQLVQEYLSQWEAIKGAEALSFETPEAEQRARAELVAYATDHDELDLEKAWLRMQRDKARDVTTAAKDKITGTESGGNNGQSKPSTAVNRSSTPTSRAPRPPAKGYDDAAERAYARLTANAGAK